MLREIWRATQGLRQFSVFITIVCVGMAADSLTMAQLAVAGMIIVGMGLTMIFD